VKGLRGLDLHDNGLIGQNLGGWCTAQQTGHILLLLVGSLQFAELLFYLQIGATAGIGTQARLRLQYIQFEDGAFVGLLVLMLLLGAWQEGQSGSTRGSSSGTRSVSLRNEG